LHALEASPGPARAVLAAFDRAASVGVTIDEVRAALRAARDAGREDATKKVAR
jgi:hypothetical protein